MKANRLLVAMFILAFTACSPATSLNTITLPTPQPTPYSIAIPVNPQGMTLTEMKDSQGRVIMKNLGNERYRFYIYEDGYDSNVGDGYLLLKAGYSYTFDWFGNHEEIEVRQISNDQLVGYALMFRATDPNGTFSGIEPLIKIVDTNSDGLVTIEELKQALSTLSQKIETIPKSQTVFTTQFSEEILAANEAINSGKIAEAYRKIKQLEIELNYIEQINNNSAATQINNPLKILLLSSIFVIIIAIFVVIFFLRQRKYSKNQQRTIEPKPAVFFVYDCSDQSRVNLVKESLEKLGNIPFGVFEPGESEELILRGDTAIMQWVDSHLETTSVSVVLVGKETCNNKWVEYSILKSIELSHGLIGVDISKIKALDGSQSVRCGKIPEGYPFYLWFKENGDENLELWIESANQNKIKNNQPIPFPPSLPIPHICPDCGREVDPNLPYCVNCGHKIKVDLNHVDQENAIQNEIPPLIPTLPASKKQLDGSKHKIWAMILGFMIIILIILFLIFIIFRKSWFNKGLEPNSSNASTQSSENFEKFIFDTNRDGNLEIYAMNIDGSNPINLSNNPAEDESPVWSPDGQKIAFSSNREGVYQIFIMNPDGSGQTRLTNSQADSALPLWSPDGRKIVYQCIQNENWEICLMNNDGSNQTLLTNNQATDGNPTWSPDGERIAFTSDRDGSWGIFVMNSDGTNQTRLTNNTWRDSTPDWSPDGQKIAFTSNRDGRYAIYVMNADGSDQTRLTNSQADDSNPGWSEDGQKIIFVSNRDENYEIYTMNADGSNQTRLTNNPAEDGYPDWYPINNVTTQSFVSTMIPTQIITLPPSNESIPADVQTQADRYFESGAMVYLYDPQPLSVSLSALNNTQFSLRYILSKNAMTVPNVIFIWKVNSIGDKEYIISDVSSIEDWENKTGLLYFTNNNLYRDMYRDQYTYDPNLAVLQAFIGMTPLYGGVNEFYVDEPIYLDVFLMSPVEQEGSFFLSDASIPLSNSVRIEVTP